MSGFLTFIFIMSFTPGPNTIMAMSEGQTNGFRKGLAFNWGILIGLISIGGIISLFTSILQKDTLIILILKMIGSAYLLYLSYHLLISKPDGSNSAGSHPLETGFLLQLTNIKCYLYFITGVSGFSITGFFGLLPIKFIIMITVGILGTLTWTLAGQLIQKFYLQHYQGLNLLIAGLLIFSVYDLWH